MSTFKYLTKTDLSRSRSPAPTRAHENYCPSAVSATQSKVKAHVATSGLWFYRPSMGGRSQAVQLRTVVEVASGRASHAWHMNGTRDPAHDFIVKLSPCMCSYLAALAGEMAWHLWDLTTLAFEICDKSCYTVPWQSRKPSSKSTFKAPCEW